MKPIKGPSRAEFERDRRLLEAAIGERMNRPLDEKESDPEQSLADSKLIGQFYVKHRARLEAEGADVAGFLSELALAKKTLEKQLIELEQLEEAALQAKANQVDSLTALEETQFHILRFYESRTQADWDKLPPEKRCKMFDLIALLREGVPAFLDSLPIEKRRELEALGPWDPSEGDFAPPVP